MFLCGGQTSLADDSSGQRSHIPYILNGNSQRTILSMKCSYLLDEDSSPDSERLQSLGDVDSGHSTAHSPVDFKSMSPQLASPSSHSPFPPPFGGVPFSQLEMLEATHRGLHKFIPRHHDEIEVEIGDPIYVQKEADDLWCEGVNLRTGRQGIFPSAYAVDLDYNDFDPCTVQVKKERYLLGYLGSVETLAHKGTGVVCQAVRKIVGEYGDSPSGQICILEVSDQGLRMVDRSRPQVCILVRTYFLDITIMSPSRIRKRKNHALTTSTRSKMCHFVHFIPATTDTLASSQNIPLCSVSPVMFSKDQNQHGL